MKKILSILLLFVVLQIAAQNTKEEVLQMVAEDTCECIAKKSIDPKATLKQKEMALGLCLISSFNEHKTKSKYYRKNKVTNYETLGEEVGVLMVGVCADDFMSLFSTEELENMVDENDINDSNTTTETLNIEGELVALKNDAISYIEIRDDFNKTHFILVTKYFEGLDVLKKSNYGKSFTIYYSEMEYFDLSEKQYVTKKVLSKIEML